MPACGQFPRDHHDLRLEHVDHRLFVSRRIHSHLVTAAFALLAIATARAPDTGHKGMLVSDGGGEGQRG